MRVVTDKEIEHLLKISDSKKYKYFINFVCDTQEIWGLYSDGWALAGENNGSVSLFPLWPSKEFASLCVSDGWSNYKPEPIILEDFMTKFIPAVQEKKLNFGVFYTPNNKGIVLSPDEIFQHINKELQKY